MSYKSNLTASGNNDYWDNSSLDIIDGFEPTICARPFGTERIFYHLNENIFDNSYGKFEQAGNNGEYPHITTERPKKDNCFLIHKGESSEKIYIYQVEP